MKILTLTTLFPNERQPIHAVFVKNRIKALSKLCEVKVVAPVPLAFPLKFLSKKYRMFSDIPSHEIQDGIEVFHPRYLVTPKFGRSLYGFMYFLSIFRFMANLREQYDFDLIDVHWAYPDGFAGVLLAKAFGKPVTITVRGSDINEYTKLPLRRRIIAYALKKADRVIAVSKDLGDKVAKLGVNRSKIKVIPNGVDIDKFYPMDKDKARKILKLPQDKKIILSVGRLSYPKRFDHLIESVNTLKKGKHYDLLLLIVGEGEHRPKLERQIRELGLDGYVRLIGSRPNEELVYWYNAADIFCLASSNEGWPNVIFESLACGTPVVAYSVGGVPEIICSEEYGILVEDQNPAMLADALLGSLTQIWDEDKILEYARGNTWDDVARKVYSTFLSIGELE
ncbi:MAG: glycosyltransferase family 4 protein [Candidatus Thorarchaeota archaeon]|nr:MAG: glycosyltransferase family 4 protein [Candidatus Thorarchaeota archaeon]